MGYGYSDDRKASVRFSSSKTNGFVSQGVRGEISHKSYRIQSTHNFQESHHMCLHFFCVCNNLRLQIICTKIASLNKSNLVVFVFLHSLCDSNELWHFHLNLNLRCVCMCVCVLLSRFSYCVCVCVCVCVLLSRFSYVCVCVLLNCFSYVQVFATPWTANCQSPLSMRFYRQEYQNGLPCLSPGDLPDPGIEPASPTGRFFTY